MYDLHYDLLTQIYINKNNTKYLKEYFKKIYNKKNITGGIFNLFYMSPKEMKEELDINLDEINIIENLKLLKDLINKYQLIPEKTKYIIGIEGLDYLNNIEEVDKLYELGVKSVNIVWNNDNKFGGGAKGNKINGLTNLGKNLVKELVDKRIAIDLSHSNEKTFYDIVNLCKELKRKGKQPTVFASHSNIKKLCNVPRNLSNNQIKEIAKLEGVIGIVGVKQFCIKENSFNNNKLKYYKAYVEHIKYLKDLLGGVDNIAISTDDMTYYGTEHYKNFNVFKQENIKKELERLLLKNGFTKLEIEKILFKNFEKKILEKL